MEDFVTGTALMKRWKIERHELMKRVTATTEKGVVIFCRELAPYSPAYFQPYECWSPLLQDAHKRAGTEYTPPPYSVKRPGDIYNSLHEALFRESDIQKYEEANPLNETKMIIRREIAMAAAKTFKQHDKKMTLPEAVEKVNGYLKDYELEQYSKKHLQRIIKDLGFPPGKSGPKSKKGSSSCYV